MLSLVIALAALMIGLVAESILNVAVFFDQGRQLGADLPGGSHEEENGTGSSGAGDTM